MNPNVWIRRKSVTILVYFCANHSYPENMSKRKTYLNSCLSEDSSAVREGVGKNIIPPPEREPLWKLYLEKFKDPIIIVLLVVFFFSIVVAGY